MTAHKAILTFGQHHEEAFADDSVVAILMTAHMRNILVDAEVGKRSPAAAHSDGGIENFPGN